MKIWHQYPFIRLAFPLLTGIWLAMHINRHIHIPLYFIAILFIVYTFIILLFQKRLSYRYRWVPGVLIYLVMLCIGFELAILRTPKYHASNILHFSGTSDIFLIEVSEPVSERQHSFKIVAKSIGIKDSLQYKPATGKVLLYFEKDSTVASLKYGDQLAIHTQLNEISPPKNPSEFDYKKYLSNRGIYNQGFVETGNWQIIAHQKGNPLKAAGLSLRDTFLDILEQNNIRGREFAVASAILLGQDNFLDTDQRKEFAGAGAMHILCVSGLHVGIIYVILNGLLLFLNKRKGGRILKVFLLLTLIWFYALVTGFSPSVLRAATMFSFVILGGLIKRHINIYNSLAASAFFLMVINPFIITEIGFQLSYLAVFGIVWLYRPVYRIFIPHNWLIDKIWQITVVSFCATLATFPLSVYYFHQFPNLFFITNLIAIPSAMLIIYSGILVLLTSFIPVVSGLFAKLLVLLLKILNTSVQFIEGISFSTIHGIYISLIELLIILLLTYCLFYFLLERKKNYLLFVLGLSVILMISISFRTDTNLKQNKIVVYHINRSTAIEFMENKTSFLLVDSLLKENPSKIDFHIRNNWIRNGTNSNANIFLLSENIKNDNIYKKGNFIQFQNKRMVLVNPELKISSGDGKLAVDYLLMVQNPDLNPADLQACFDFEEMIIDASNPTWKIQRWINYCDEKNIGYYLVRDQGAWEMRI